MIRVTQFQKSFDRKNFDCGVDGLNRYLQQQLGQEARRSLAAGFILHEEGSTEILGYYTLSAFSVEIADIPSDIRKNLPRYSHIPATLLGRLAISRSAQGKGFGELLLLDAMRRAWENRAIIGSWAFVVDALGENALRFYRHYEFREVDSVENRLLLDMKEVGKLFDAK